MPKSFQDPAPAPLTVLLLWHMHQPFYVIPGQRRALLPWARLHALKDYVDMPRLLSEFPTVRATFNLVPSLLWQLQQYAEGRLTDIDLDLSKKPAAELTKEERIYLLRNFFSLDWTRILPRLPRLAQLLKKRGRLLHREKLPQLAEEFTVQEFLDIQVLFNLGWSGNVLLESQLLRALLRKERGFTEEDKTALLQIQADFLSTVIPTYRLLAAAGQAEIAASPLYHPILPLLVSTDFGRLSDSRTPVPERRFNYPNDAGAQISKAIRVMEAEFGFRCAGMWPSEGSVADEIVPFWHAAGIRWVASDEEVLWNSM
ncbi:MAG TPA: hypothetical protein VGP94_04830, partial [Tepidisphaeraceae bacterium]|nr:hypothetical protein [Tepidisphaeraceae bacterium]